MLLAIQYGAVIDGAEVDLVRGHHREDQAPPLSAYPGCVVIGWSGDLNTLDRVGLPIYGLSGNADGRMHKAPPFDPVAYAAARRWMLVRAGLTVNGTSVPTDDAARASLGETARRAAAKPGDTIIKFKLDGAWVEMPASQIVALDIAVGDHVQACFDAEEAVDAAVAAGARPTRAEIEAGFQAKIPHYTPVA